MSGLHQVGFLKSLFDFKLKHFITLRVLSIIYALSVLVILISGVACVYQVQFGSFRTSQRLYDFGYMLLFIVMTFATLVAARLWIEFVANLYRIGENTKILATKALESTNS